MRGSPSGGKWPGNHSISRSIAGCFSVSEAWYWRLQRATCRAM